jgi:hypothetical protein
MKEADDIFKNFFGNNDPFQSFFQDDNDFFSSPFGSNGM